MEAQVLCADYLVVLHFCELFFLFLVILQLKMAPKCSTEVLSGVHKCKKGVACLMGKKCSNKLGSGMSHGAIGWEFNVNESTVIPK